MPPWLEVLLNVIGFAGFIGIAKYHKSRGEKGDVPIAVELRRADVAGMNVTRPS
jgi:hypothetical protein